VLQSIEVYSVGTADAVRKSVLLQCIIAVCYYCVLQWVAVNVRGRERELNIENCSTENCVLGYVYIRTCEMRVFYMEKHIGRQYVVAVRCCSVLVRNIPVGCEDVGITNIVQHPRTLWRNIHIHIYVSAPTNPRNYKHRITPTKPVGERVYTYMCVSNHERKKLKPVHRPRTL
jgi:hypothetical protein